MARVKGPDSENLVAEERLRHLVGILREAGATGATKEALREELGVDSIRTVDRALGLLEKQGALLERGWTQVGGDGGSRRVMTVALIRGPKWDETISAPARLALSVILNALQGGMASVWTEHLAMVEKLVEGKLTNRDRRLLEQLKGKVVTYGPASSPGSPGPAVLRPVLEALGSLHSRTLRVKYRTAYRNREEELKVVPWCLVHDLFSGGAFLLVWDPGPGKAKHLRLDRMLEAGIEGAGVLTPGIREKLERAARYQIGGWINEGEPFEISVRISGANWVQALMDQPPALPEAKIEKQTGGTGLLTFKATEYRAPARWVLQMGPDAEVLGPGEFREFVADRARKAAEVYGS